ncbi:MAG TPA: ferritin family protein [Tepidisphaeraceae bacterium]|jgi:rubrerythrin|nr:ferritin family protein [Tepidisphaeraceae bacterium]
MPRPFSTLSEQEILSLAITLEDTDSRIYSDFAAGLREHFPASAAIFDQMHTAEISHRDRLTALYKQRFGDHLPMIRREDVRGFLPRKPVWLIRPLGLDVVRRHAAQMESETLRFYAQAAARTTDPATRDLLLSLSEEERHHESLANDLTRDQLTPAVRSAESEAKRRLFVLQIVQPGLAGLMDGSVSTLAPLFAAAFATHNRHHEAFLIGLAASIGAGISMGFAEALSDDGKLTGRGQPLLRGLSCGLMTTLGGIGHTLPYLISNFYSATTLAIGVVILELIAIAYIRNRYMDTPLLRASLQIILGGLLVFLTGILIGNA